MRVTALAISLSALAALTAIHAVAAETHGGAGPVSEEAAMKIMLKAYPGSLKNTQTFGPFESTLQSDVPTFAKKGEKVWYLGIKCNKGEPHASFFVHPQTAKLFFIRGPGEKLPLQCD